MSDFKQQFLGGMVKRIAFALTGALLFWCGQTWIVSDLEYKIIYKDGYLPAPLGQQGLAMAFNNKPLKNISIVEFVISNRTKKQHDGVEFIFSVNDKRSSPNLVSAGMIAPVGIPQSEAIEEIPTNDSLLKKFNIKIFPAQKQSESYHAIFIFDGEKAPEMSVVSRSNDVMLINYQQWRDNLFVSFITIVFVLCVALVLMGLQSFFDYFAEPGRHKKVVEKFVNHVEELKKSGKLTSNFNEDIRIIYASFVRPKPSKFWSKIFGVQRYEYTSDENDNGVH